MNSADDRGQPAGRTEPKRPNAILQIGVDWHDELVNLREVGAQVSPSYCVRPERRHHTGLQYRCTTAGITNGDPNLKINWPRAAGGSVQDGTVVWTAEPADANSVRATVQSNSWSAPSAITLSAQTSGDFKYRANAAGGVSGAEYEISHTANLSDGRKLEGLILLPVLS